MFRIVQPCQKKWSELAGDDTRRYCEDCGLHVHNLASYTEREQRELARVPGRLCALIGPPRLPRRVMLLTGLAGMLRPLWAKTAAFKVLVVDLTGEVVPKAEVRVLDRNDKVVAVVNADDSGLAILPNLPQRQPLLLQVHSPGFKTFRQSLEAKQRPSSITVRLELGQLLGDAIVIPLHD